MARPPLRRCQPPATPRRRRRPVPAELARHRRGGVLPAGPRGLRAHAQLQVRGEVHGGCGWCASLCWGPCGWAPARRQPPHSQSTPVHSSLPPSPPSPPPPLWPPRSGCGNTVNANHPATLQQIVDSLRWWVEEYHVDGFRFDLGAPRAEWGHARLRPGLIETFPDWGARTASASTCVHWAALGWAALGWAGLGFLPACRRLAAGWRTHTVRRPARAARAHLLPPSSTARTGNRPPPTPALAAARAPQRPACAGTPRAGSCPTRP